MMAVPKRKQPRPITTRPKTGKPIMYFFFYQEFASAFIESQNR